MLLISELPPSRVQAFPVDQQYQISLLMGAIAFRIGLFQEAIGYWTLALEGSVFFQDHDSQVKILYELGFLQRKLENYPEATAFYKKAFDLADPNMSLFPTILNDWGYACFLMNDEEQATSLVKQALDMREHRLLTGVQYKQALLDQLEKLDVSEQEKIQNEIARLKTRIHQMKFEIGLSHNTLGQIKRFKKELLEAVNEYTVSKSLFSEVQEAGWEVEALCGRGDAYRLLEKKRIGENGCAATGNYDLLAYQDISQAMEMCENLNLTLKIGLAYRRMGQLLYDRFLKVENPDQKITYYHQAKSYFENAYQLVNSHQQTLDIFKVLFALIELREDYVVYGLEHGIDLVTKEVQEIAALLDSLQSLIVEQKKRIRGIHQLPEYEFRFLLHQGNCAFIRREESAAFEYHLRGLNGLTDHLACVQNYETDMVERAIRIVQAAGTPQQQEKWWHSFNEVIKKHPLKNSCNRRVGKYPSEW